MPPTRLSRRRLLSLGFAGLAGCVSSPGGGHSTTTREETDGTGSDSSSSTPTETTTTATVEPAYDTALPHDETAWAGYDPDWTAPATAPSVDLSSEVLVENLEIPWDLSFAAGGDLFLTERTGRVLRYREGEVVGVTEPRDAIDAEALPPGSDEGSWFVKGGEGGTMGVAVHPGYPDLPLVYVYYTARSGGSKVNRLAYFDVSADDPGRHSKTLLEVPAGRIHNGGRIAFGPANYLWITTGETGESALARDPTSLAGKVLRVTPEGEPAPGNPDLGADADPRVFTLGHRNPQGIGWLPDATPVVDEHGPGPDEVNVLESGGDYGWDAARGPDAYRGSGFHVPVASSLVEKRVWAPSGSVFYTGDRVPALRNRLLVGCLGSQRLKVFTLTRPGDPLPPTGEDGTRYDADWLDADYVATSHDALVDELGRIRHVEQGPDGALYAITSNRDGRASGAFPTERDDVLVRITQS